MSKRNVVGRGAAEADGPLQVIVPASEVSSSLMSSGSGSGTSTERLQPRVRRLVALAPYSLGVVAAVTLLVLFIASDWRRISAALSLAEGLHALATLRTACTLDNCCPPASADLVVAPVAEARLSVHRARLADAMAAHDVRSATDAFGVSPDSFTVVMNTFRGRDVAVGRLMRAYASCPQVALVLVSWNDVGREVPKALRNVESELAGKAAIEVERTTNLTNRFRPRPSIRTQAVFTADDDVQFSCKALGAGFRAWRTDPTQLVGFAPRRLRLHPAPPWEPSLGCNFRYFFEEGYETGRYNTVFITKGGFSHAAFFSLFHEDVDFAPIRALVNEATTAEDIAMSFLHTLYAGAGKVRAVRLVCDNQTVVFMDDPNSLGSRTSSHRMRISNAIYHVLRERKFPDAVFNLAGDTQTWAVLPDAALQLAPDGVPCTIG